MIGITPLGAILRGLVAGAVGTLAMDAVWYMRYHRGGGKEKFLDWELSTNLTSWDKAPAPALIGKRIVEGFTGQPLPAERAALMNNFMHWAYGIGWGTAYGILAGSYRAPSWRSVSRLAPLSGARVMSSCLRPGSTNRSGNTIPKRYGRT